jgi:hypothetical protein
LESEVSSKIEIFRLVVIVTNLRYLRAENSIVTNNNENDDDYDLPSIE